MRSIFVTCLSIPKFQLKFPYPKHEHKISLNLISEQNKKWDLPCFKRPWWMDRERRVCVEFGFGHRTKLKKSLLDNSTGVDFGCRLGWEFDLWRFRGSGMKTEAWGSAPQPWFQVTRRRLTNSQKSNPQWQTVDQFDVRSISHVDWAGKLISEGSGTVG